MAYPIDGISIVQGVPQLNFPLNSALFPVNMKLSYIYSFTNQTVLKRQSLSSVAVVQSMNLARQGYISLGFRFVLELLPRYIEVNFVDH